MTFGSSSNNNLLSSNMSLLDKNGLFSVMAFSCITWFPQIAARYIETWDPQVRSHIFVNARNSLGNRKNRNGGSVIVKRKHPWGCLGISVLTMCYQFSLLTCSRVASDSCVPEKAHRSISTNGLINILFDKVFVWHAFPACDKKWSPAGHLLSKNAMTYFNWYEIQLKPNLICLNLVTRTRTLTWKSIGKLS